MNNDHYYCTKTASKPEPENIEHLLYRLAQRCFIVFTVRTCTVGMEDMLAIVEI